MSSTVSLKDISKTRFPVLWARTDEPRRLERVCESFSTVASRKLYRKNLLEGLQVYDATTKKWLIELTEESVSPEGLPILPRPIFDSLEALVHVMREQGIYVLHNAHIYIEEMIPLLTQVCNDWLDGFYCDDAEEMGPTIILASYKDEVPKEIKHLAARFDMEYPTEQELFELVEYMSTNVGLNLDAGAMSLVARAGKGLSEPEFLTATVQNLAEDHAIDAKRISSIKIKQISAGGNLEIKIPKYTLDTVGGLDRAKEILIMNAWMFQHPEECAKQGVLPQSKMILVGVSGCGKSLLAEAAADAYNLDLAVFNVSGMMSKWVGESESNMRDAFRQINALAPIVLWTDEVGRDFSGGSSSSHTDGGVTDRTHGILLSGLQELPNDVFWIGAANSLAALPPEMLRAGRIDQLLFIGFPTQKEREEIFKIHLGDHYHLYDLDKLARATPQFTGAEIQSLIKRTRFQIVGRYHRTPTNEDVIECANNFKDRVWRLHRDEILAMYRQAQQEWTWASSDQEKESGLIFDADSFERRGGKGRTQPTNKVPTLAELSGKSN